MNVKSAFRLALITACAVVFVSTRLPAQAAEKPKPNPNAEEAKKPADYFGAGWDFEKKLKFETLVSLIKAEPLLPSGEPNTDGIGVFTKYNYVGGSSLGYYDPRNGSINLRASIICYQNEYRWVDSASTLIHEHAHCLQPLTPWPGTTYGEEIEAYCPIDTAWTLTEKLKRAEEAFAWGHHKLQEQDATIAEISFLTSQWAQDHAGTSVALRRLAWEEVYERAGQFAHIYHFDSLSDGCLYLEAASKLLDDIDTMDPTWVALTAPLRTKIESLSKAKDASLNEMNRLYLAYRQLAP